MCTKRVAYASDHYGCHITEPSNTSKSTKFKSNSSIGNRQFNHLQLYYHTLRGKPKSNDYTCAIGDLVKPENLLTKPELFKIKYKEFDYVIFSVQMDLNVFCVRSKATSLKIAQIFHHPQTWRIKLNQIMLQVKSTIILVVPKIHLL